MEYQYLYSRTSGDALVNSGGKSVESDYSLTDLRYKTVIKNDYDNLYRVFSTQPDATEWHDSLDARHRNCHEVIFGNNPQRIKFDIDALESELLKISTTDTPTAMIDTIMNSLLDAMIDEIEEIFMDECPAREDFILTDNSGDTTGGYKYSFHVIVSPFYLTDNEEAKQFTAKVLDRIPTQYHRVIDAGVNKRVQNFRMLGSAKKDTTRVKRHSTKYECSPSAQTCSTMYISATHGSKVLPRGYDEPVPYKSADVLPETTQSILESLASSNILAGHEYKETRGTLMIFMRTAPSYCRICNETHHNDNTLMVSIKLSDDGTVTLFELCRHCKGKSCVIGDVDLATTDVICGIAAPIIENYQDPITRRLDKIKSGKIAEPLISTDTTPSNSNIYSEPQMQNYELRPTLVVHAQMKLGKTKALHELLATHFPSNSLRQNVVRFLTFRQTFSSSISKDFTDFDLYNESRGDLTDSTNPRLIIQVESLHRLKVFPDSEPVDLIILDEVESVLAQFGSGLHKHFGASFAIFEHLMRTAKHVICMDANISDRTYNILRRFRPDYPAYLHWNQFARAADDQYYITTNQGAWLSTLYQKLDAGDRVVIATNSLADAKSHEHALNQAYPNKKIALYSSEMAASVRVRHFSDVHTYWGGLDCLIYTPTCSAGVSFELKHFNAFFGFFCNTSCDVPTCRQMIGRVRDISSHEHYICLKTMGSDKSLPTTPEAVDRMLHDKRAGLYRTVDSAALQFSYTPQGDIKFYKSGYYSLWVENMCIANQSTGNFINLFIDQVTRSGATINQLIVADDAKVRASTFREAGREIKAIRWVDIAAAPDMSDEEVHEIRSAAGQIDITYPLRMQLEKYKIRTIFRVTDTSVITTDFVRAYSPHGIIQTFFNLQKIVKYNTIATSLAKIQFEERSKFENTMDAPTVLNRECIDLVASDKSYSFQTHYIATWLVSLCGFKCIFDKNSVLDAHLVARLRGSIGMLNSAMSRISFEFKCAIPNFNTMSQEPNDAKFLTKIMRMVNRILHEVYGMSIGRAKGSDMYRINHSGAGVIFDTTCTSEALPHIRVHLDPIPLDNKVIEFILRWYYLCYDGHDHICP